MAQESRFKNYKSHLELVLNDYREVCESIPGPLKNLFAPHTEYVNQQLQPGLTTLAWNSMNIGNQLIFLVKGNCPSEFGKILRLSKGYDINIEDSFHCCNNAVHWSDVKPVLTLS